MADFDCRFRERNREASHAKVWLSDLVVTFYDSAIGCNRDRTDWSPDRRLYAGELFGSLFVCRAVVPDCLASRDFRPHVDLIDNVVKCHVARAVDSGNFQCANGSAPQLSFLVVAVNRGVDRRDLFDSVRKRFSCLELVLQDISLVSRLGRCFIECFFSIFRE